MDGHWLQWLASSLNTFFMVFTAIKKTQNKTNIFPATLIPKISKNNLKLHCIAHEVVCHFVPCGLYLEHFQTWQTGDGFRLEFEQMPNLRYILMKMINSFRARQHHNPQVWSITVTSTAQTPSFTKTDSLQKGFCCRYCLCADLFSSELKVAALQTNCQAGLATFHQICYLRIVSMVCCDMKQCRRQLQE